MERTLSFVQAWQEMGQILLGSNDEIVSTNVAPFYSETHAVNSFHAPDYPDHLSQWLFVGT